MDRSEIAIKQIREKEYYKKYLNDERVVKIIGSGFDVEKKEFLLPIIEVIK